MPAAIRNRFFMMPKGDEREYRHNGVGLTSHSVEAIRFTFLSFGFSKPSDPDTPETPDNLVVVPGAPGRHMLFIDWDDALRSTSYRVRVTKDATPSAELKNVIVNNTEVTINDLASGTPIKVTVSDRNSKGGESAATDPVSATVP
jgi:hypothetical protein